MTQMEIEVRSFLESLGSNLRKVDIELLAQKLGSVQPEWIRIFQAQLTQGYWPDAPLERQLSMLYVLNAYFKEAYKNKVDLDNWIETVNKMLLMLRVKDTSKEKEIKHVVKLVTIWGLKEKDPKVRFPSSKRRLSIFPKENCDQWLDVLNSLATECGIKATTTDAENTTGSLSLLHPGVDVEVTTLEVQHKDVVRSMNEAHAQNRNKHIQGTTSTSNAIQFNAPKTYSSMSVPIVPAPVVDVMTELNNGLVQAVCKFQMQVFQSFACHATRRLDRWNMNIVMLSAYHLLHLYLAENGVVDVSAGPLVVACIYLSGKAEYLFVKADKLRQVANKFVRNINEPVMINNLQVYKYEAELLRMLQYNVGAIPNPLRCLKALDIHEANLCGAISLDVAPINPSNLAVSSSNNPQDAKPTVINLSEVGQLHPSDLNAGAVLNQARRLIDDAVSVFVSEGYLFSEQLILLENDFYLATAVLLEKTQRAFGLVDPRECDMKASKFLRALSALSPVLRQQSVLSVSSSGGAPSAFMNFLSSLRQKKGDAPITSDALLSEDGEIATSETSSTVADPHNTAARTLGSAVFFVSHPTIETVRRVLPAVEREVREERAARDREKAVAEEKLRPKMIPPPMFVPPTYSNFVPSSSAGSSAVLLGGNVGANNSRNVNNKPAWMTSGVMDSRQDPRAETFRDQQSTGRGIVKENSRDRGDKRGRARSRSGSVDRVDSAKKSRLDRSVDLSREATHTRDIRDNREGRDSRDRDRRRDSRDRNTNNRGPPLSQGTNDSRDGGARDRRRSSSRDKARDSGNNRGRSPARDERSREYYNQPPQPESRFDQRIGERNPFMSQESQRRGDNRDIRDSRGRSPPRGMPSRHSSLLPPPPPGPPPAQSLSWEQSNTGKRRRGDSRSPSRRPPPPPSQAPLPPQVPPLPFAPPPPTSSYTSARSSQDVRSNDAALSMRRQAELRRQEMRSFAGSGSIRFAPNTTLREVEEGEEVSDSDSYCQFIGSSAPTSSAPTPFIASGAPPPPRVGPSQSTTQLWMPADAEDDSPPLPPTIPLPPTAPPPVAVPPVVDLTKASPISNTSALQKLAQPPQASLLENLNKLANISQLGSPPPTVRAVLPVPPTIPSIPAVSLPSAVKLVRTGSVEDGEVSDSTADSSSQHTKISRAGANTSGGDQVKTVSALHTLSKLTTLVAAAEGRCAIVPPFSSPIVPVMSEPATVAPDSAVLETAVPVPAMASSLPEAESVIVEIVSKVAIDTTPNSSDSDDAPVKEVAPALTEVESVVEIVSKAPADTTSDSVDAPVTEDVHNVVEEVAPSPPKVETVVEIVSEVAVDTTPDSVDEPAKAVEEAAPSPHEAEVVVETVSKVATDTTSDSIDAPVKEDVRTVVEEVVVKNTVLPPQLLVPCALPTSASPRGNEKASTINNSISTVATVENPRMSDAVPSEEVTVTVGSEVSNAVVVLAEVTTVTRTSVPTAVAPVAHVPRFAVINPRGLSNTTTNAGADTLNSARTANSTSGAAPRIAIIPPMVPNRALVASTSSATATGNTSTSQTGKQRKASTAEIETPRSHHPNSANSNPRGGANQPPAGKAGKGDNKPNNSMSVDNANNHVHNTQAERRNTNSGGDANNQQVLVSRNITVIDAAARNKGSNSGGAGYSKPVDRAYGNRDYSAQLPVRSIIVNSSTTNNNNNNTDYTTSANNATATNPRATSPRSSGGGSASGGVRGGHTVKSMLKSIIINPQSQRK